jgi:hypothetical protein
MNRGMFGSSSNLPPGVTESMIPGNRPIDAAFDREYDARGCLCCAWYEKCELRDNSKMTCGLWKEDPDNFDERYYAQEAEREDDWPEPPPPEDYSAGEESL